MLKQREEQDQVGSESLIRSRQIRHDRALEEDEAMNDLILARSTAVTEDGEEEVKSK